MEKYQREIAEIFAKSLIDLGNSIIKILEEEEKKNPEVQEVDISSEIKKYPPMMTIKEVSEILGIPRRRMYDLLDEWDIPYSRLSERRIRIPRDSFFLWLEKRG